MDDIGLAAKMVSVSGQDTEMNEINSLGLGDAVGDVETDSGVRVGNVRAKLSLQVEVLLDGLGGLIVH